MIVLEHAEGIEPSVGFPNGFADRSVHQLGQRACWRRAGYSKSMAVRPRFA